MSDKLLLPLQYKRQYSGPLDADIVFDTISDMDIYKNSPLSYSGMVVSCLETETVYILNNAKTVWNVILSSGGTDKWEYFGDTEIKPKDNKLVNVSSITGLSNVSLSNDYNDLDNKPFIPTILGDLSGFTELIESINNISLEVDTKTDLTLFYNHTGSTNPHLTSFNDLVNTAHTHLMSDTNFNDTNYVHSNGNEFINGEKIFTNDTYIQGNLYVSGSATTTYAENLTVSNNIIFVNTGETQSGVSLVYAGLEIDRGLLDNARIVWNENIKKWELGTTNDMTVISLVGHIHDDLYYTKTEVNNNFLSASTTITNLNGYTIQEVNNNFLSASTTIGNLNGYTKQEVDTLINNISGSTTGSSNINGACFITNVTSSGNISNKIYSSDGLVLESFYTDSQSVTVYLVAIPGWRNYKPNIYLNGSAVTLTIQGSGPQFTGSINVNLDSVTALTIQHEDGAYHTTIVNYDSKPIITNAFFTGGYPGSQSELKAGDTYQFRILVDQSIVQVELSDYDAFNSGVYTVSGSGVTITGTIANRGTTSSVRYAKVRVKKSNGTWSDWYTTSGVVNGTNFVYLNNMYPIITLGAINYPSGQGALKNSESATVNHTITNANTYNYTSTQLTITNSTTYETAKIVSRNTGDYNLSNNLTISATKASNNAVTTTSTAVKIAHIAAIISITKSSRLRSGGNNNTSAQNHTITLTSTQYLSVTPTLTAPTGTWQGTDFVTSNNTTWTRSLQIHDNMIRGTHTFTNLVITNLAGVSTTIIGSGADYIIGGFVTRTITIPAFGTECLINVAVTDYTKISNTLNWSFKTLTTKRSIDTTTTPDANAWCMANIVDSGSPTSTIRILDTAAASSSSQASTITIEETM